VGLAAFFAASYLLTKGRPDRNGLLFATVFALFYVLFDVATIPVQDVLNIEFLLSMLANLVAALAGTYFAVGARTSVSFTTDQ
jgi:hypothetical protein